MLTWARSVLGWFMGQWVGPCWPWPGLYYINCLINFNKQLWGLQGVYEQSFASGVFACWPALTVYLQGAHLQLVKYKRFYIFVALSRLQHLLHLECDLSNLISLPASLFLWRTLIVNAVKGQWMDPSYLKYKTTFQEKSKQKKNVMMLCG